MRKPATVLATLGLGAVVVAGLISPAQAADDVTVSIRVVDTKGRPVKDLSVSLTTDSLYRYLGETDANGVLRASRDTDGETIPKGRADLAVLDDGGAREAAGTRYVDLRESVTIESGSNDLGTKTVIRTSRVKGTLTAPSKRPIRNVLMQMSTSDDVGNVTSEFSTTDAKGRFRFGNLEAGEWEILRNESAEAGFPSIVVAQVTIGVDEDLEGDALDAQVQCDVERFKATSTGVGKVKLSVRASAPRTGLTNPKGRVVITRASKVVKTIKVTTGKTISTTITKQPRGKRVAYTAHYDKGDCSEWIIKRSVKVRK